MIASFKNKLEQMQENRKRTWKPVRNLQSEIKSLKPQASELNDFLADLDIGLEGQKNAYGKDIDAKTNKLKNNYPIYETDVIDLALGEWKNKKPTSKNNFEKISQILNNPKKSGVHYDAAMALVAIAEFEMKKAKSYAEAEKYRPFLEHAFSVLVKEKDADIYYAQWGLIIYEICLQKCLMDKNETLCVQECKQAYDKFSKVSSNIPEISTYAGYSSGEAKEEVKLLLMNENIINEDAMRMINFLLDTQNASKRKLIRQYRFQILDSAVMKLAGEGKSLGENEQRILSASDYFLGDIDDLLQKYREKRQSVLNQNKIDETKKEARALKKKYVEAKKYTQVLPEEYLFVDSSKYEEKLSQFIEQRIGNISSGFKVNDAWFDRQVSEYVKGNASKFESLIEEQVVSMVQNYCKGYGYRKVIPEAYKNIETSNYSEKLQSYILGKASTIQNKNELNATWLNEKAKEFIKENESYLKNLLADKCVADYRKKVKLLVKEKNEMPKYAVGYYDGIDNYKRGLEASCLRQDICGELKNFALKNGWNGVVPDAEVQKYYKKAETLIKANINERKSNAAKQTITQKGDSFKPISTEKPKRKISLKKVIGIVCVVLWLLPTIVSVAISGVSTLLSGNSLEGKTDDEIWAYMEEKMEDYDAELSPTATPASDFSYEKGYIGDTIRITKYNGTAEVVEIPAVIDGKNVTYIDDNAFADNIYLKKVIMPDTICMVRGNAFANCTLLEEVVFSKNTSAIMGYAFYNCTSLKSVTLTSDMSSLANVQSSAFEGCTALETVNITSDIFANVGLGDSAFLGCTALKEVNISGERLESVTLGASTFNGASSLTTISFADKIVSMGDAAFANCISLKDIYLPNVETISNAAFENCTGLTSFIVSSSVKYIDCYAFRNCTSLSSVTFEPVTLEAEESGCQIQDQAFANTAITEIEIPGSYEYIGIEPFTGCSSLTKVIWHNSGKNTLNQSIAYAVFSGCENLQEVYLPRTLGDASDLDIPSYCTIYAMEGSSGHTYAVENNIPWSPWTE